MLLLSEYTNSNDIKQYTKQLTSCSTAHGKILKGKTTVFRLKVI